MNKVAIIGHASPALGVLDVFTRPMAFDLNPLVGLGGFSYPISSNRNTGAAKAKRAARKRRNAG